MKPIFLFLSIIIIYFQGLAAKDSPSSDLYYYDGGQRIELTIKEGLVAEFGVPANSTSQKSNISSPILIADPKADLLRKQGNVHIWKTNAQGGSVSTSKSLNQSKRIGYSPVFRSSQDGTLLALPGNIIVEFSPSLSHSHIENWLAMKGLRPVKKLEIANRNFYEVETPAGVPALNLANSLVGQEGVVSSSPNWWREVSPK